MHVVQVLHCGALSVPQSVCAVNTGHCLSVKPSGSLSMPPWASVLRCRLLRGIGRGQRGASAWSMSIALPRLCSCFSARHQNRADCSTPTHRRPVALSHTRTPPVTPCPALEPSPSTWIPHCREQRAHLAEQGRLGDGRESLAIPALKFRALARRRRLPRARTDQARLH